MRPVGSALFVEKMSRPNPQSPVRDGLSNTLKSSIFNQTGQAEKTVLDLVTHLDYLVDCCISNHRYCLYIHPISLPLAMAYNPHILDRIRETVHSAEPTAEVILFGSRAKKKERADSDIDILVLVDTEVVTRELEKKIKYPLYEIEFDTGIIISPIVLSKKKWESRHKVTPFYREVEDTGITL